MTIIIEDKSYRKYICEGWRYVGGSCAWASCVERAQPRLSSSAPRSWHTDPSSAPGGSCGHCHCTHKPVTSEQELPHLYTTVMEHTHPITFYHHSQHFNRCTTNFLVICDGIFRCQKLHYNGLSPLQWAWPAQLVWHESHTFQPHWKQICAGRVSEPHLEQLLQFYSCPLVCHVL